jgi:hypothetical protein
MTTAERQQTNYKRLQLIHRNLRPKIAAVLTDLEGHNAQPLIDAKVWRRPSEQLALYRQGFSRVKYSFHNCTGKSGSAEALASDIIDARYFWDSPSWFWLKLAASAKAHGLESGIYWGLNTFQRDQITDAITNHDWTRAPLSLGWDVAHVQVKGISLLRAKLGARP